MPKLVVAGHGGGDALTFWLPQKQACPKLREVGRGSFMTLVSALGATNKALRLKV